MYMYIRMCMYMCEDFLASQLLELELRLSQRIEDRSHSIPPYLSVYMAASHYHLLSIICIEAMRVHMPLHV